MRFRLTVWTFVLGSVVGAAGVLVWLNTGDGAPTNVRNSGPSAAQTLVVFPTDDAKPVPRDWQPREFNGKTYYVVPLSGGRSRA